MWWDEDQETGVKQKTSFKEYPYITYVRVSTEKDEQAESIPNQIDICRFWIEQNGFEWSDDSILLDDGKSGTLFLERAAMQLILEKARKREIKMVVFKSIHRLARDLKDALEIKETFIGNGVRLVTMEEGYDSHYEGKNDMKFEMYSMFAAQYPKTQSVSISAVLAAKVRRGEHIGPIPFGFDREDKKLVIKEEEAHVIRMIFKWYNNDGFGFKRITSLLNEELEKGNIVPPKKKDKWQVTSVQRMIKNPVYCGIFILNRYTNIKVKGKKKQIQNPREKWLIFKNQHPKIISEEEYKQANTKEVVNKKSKVTPWNEFRGLLKCKECGSNMVILQGWNKRKDGTKVRWRYLKCSTYRRMGNHGCINHTPILYEDFRAFVLKRLKQKGKNVAVQFENNLQKKKESEIMQLEKSISQLEEMSKGLIDLYLKDKIISKVEFQVKRREYEKDIQKLSDRVYILKQEDDHQMDVETIQEAFKQLDRHGEDLHHAFSTLINEATIHQDGTVDFNYTFELHE